MPFFGLGQLNWNFWTISGVVFLFLFIFSLAVVKQDFFHFRVNNKFLF